MGSIPNGESDLEDGNKEMHGGRRIDVLYGFRH